MPHLRLPYPGCLFGSYDLIVEWSHVGRDTLVLFCELINVSRFTVVFLLVSVPLQSQPFPSMVHSHSIPQVFSGRFYLFERYNIFYFTRTVLTLIISDWFLFMVKKGFSEPDIFTFGSFVP